VSAFPLAQFLTAVSWGRASDRHGRKPVILFSLTCTMITSLLWGFSSSIWMALAVRALAGAANGTVGIIRTSVAEMVPWKELQPRAFSVMPLVWNIGSIFGPTLGGALANPYHVRPGQVLPDDASLFERFPYALPNMLAVILFLAGISIGILFLEVCNFVAQLIHNYLQNIGNACGKEGSSRLRTRTWPAIKTLYQANIQEDQKLVHSNRRSGNLRD
jgi:MFS family permease